MAVGDKPYRLYRGGRTKGRVPLEPRTGPPGGPTKPAGPKGPRRRRWALWIGLGFAGLLVLFVLWSVLGYLSFSRGVDKANNRLPRRALNRLATPAGSLISNPTTILVVGTDGGSAPGRGDARRSDSIQLIRTDPGKNRLSYLSFPRDLRVDIPGHGADKINSANQFGAVSYPPLTLPTTERV
jgi:polyisoprenyl-teichoic acid--peptidoglycan teichoic acid transferase